MGGFFSRVLDWLTGPKDRCVLMLGLPEAGKTSILSALRRGGRLRAPHTTGFNFETVAYKDTEMTVFLWRKFAEDPESLIFVVDSVDAERLGEAKEELHGILSADAMKNLSVLVYATKQDMAGALPAADIAKGLGMRELPCFDWFVQPCSAVTKDGLYEGLDWLVESMTKRDVAIAQGRSYGAGRRWW